MKIQRTQPRERFQGLSETGFLQYPNRYFCPHCAYGIFFTQESLARESNDYWKSKTHKSRLQEEQRKELETIVKDLLKREDVDFVLDFNCPKCRKPVVIAFEAHEFHMADMRYRPVQIIETVDENASGEIVSRE